MKKIKEFLQLVALNLLAVSRNFIEYIRVVFRYYGNADFRKADLQLLSKYLFKNPFRMSRHFLVKKGEEEIHVYGETPLTTLEKIVKECQICADDTVFEMGCGRGRGCLWLRTMVGCRVVGIEWVPTFVSAARSAAKRAGLQGIEFRHEDMFESDYTGATVVYLYGTSLSEERAASAAKKLSTLPKGTKVITVSYPLTDYDKESFEVMRLFPERYTWGEADVYLQMVK